MLFTSMHFLYFYACLWPLYWALQRRVWMQNLLLLAASYFFYGYMHWLFPFCLSGLTLISFSAGLFIQNAAGEGKKRLVLGIGIATLLLPLLLLKYHAFVLTSIGFRGPDTLYWMVPVGLSFYTFSTLGYLMDVYRRKTNPEKSLLRFSVYTALFPYLLSGPIPRSSHMLPALNEPRIVDGRRMAEAMVLVAWGLLLKMVVSDHLGGSVSYAFGRAENISGGGLWTGALAFTLQLYADFAGYSAMAVGLLLGLGFRLPPNFLFPYFSSSLQEFWQRWHISLSTWFRDYLYFPLGGSRAGAWRGRMNVLLVFGISGLWHGAGYTYLVWGLMHGAGLITERWWMQLSASGQRGVHIFQRIILLAFIVTAWVFFRAANLSQAWMIVKKMYSPAAGFGKIPYFLVQYLPWAGAMMLAEAVWFFQIRKQSWGRHPAGMLLIALLSLIIVWFFHKKVNSAEYYYFKY